MAPVPAASEFCFPTPVLQNATVKLIPFSLEKHAQRFYDITKEHDEIYTYTNNGPYDSLQHITDAFLVPGFFSGGSKSFAYAVIDKTRPPSAEDPDGEVAGLFSYENADKETLTVEIGHVRVAPAYQRKGIAVAATALMTRYAMEAVDRGGLGLARVGWGASTVNQASIRTARKAGFNEVGFIPYHAVIKNGVARQKIGNGRRLPPRANPGDLYRDVVMFCITCEEWEDGKRDYVLGLIGDTKSNK